MPVCDYMCNGGVITKSLRKKYLRKDLNEVRELE